MNDLTEIRGPHHAFEMRGNAEVSHADAETRMRALGCPEWLLTRIRTRSLNPRKRSAEPPRRGASVSLASTYGFRSDAEMQAADDANRRSVARCQARKMATQSNADLRARAARLGAVIAADAVQERKDNELRERMENAAGRISTRSKADSSLGYPYEQAGSGAPTIYPYKELASAISKQFPDHTLVHADATTAYTKTSDGMKYSIPYSQNADGSHTFQQPRLGGHPAYMGISAGDDL